MVSAYKQTNKQKKAHGRTDGRTETHLVKDLATWLVRPETRDMRAEAVTSAS